MMNKRVISMLLCLFMLFALVPQGVFADDSADAASAEDVPAAEEPAAAEEAPATEEIPQAAEEIPQAAEEIPQAAEEAPAKTEELPTVTEAEEAPAEESAAQTDIPAEEPDFEGEELSPADGENSVGEEPAACEETSADGEIPAEEETAEEEPGTEETGDGEEDEIPEEPETEDEDESEEDEEEEEECPFPSCMTRINPLYSGLISASDIPEAPDLSEEALNNCFNADYLDLDSAAAQLAAGIAARQSTITVNIKVDKERDFWLEVYNMESRALRHTGSPIGGDYIEYQYGGTNYKLQGYRSDSSYYYATLIFSPYYFTTAAQESAVSSKVGQIISSLGLNSASLSKYEKVCRIYSYMCKNIRYDYGHMNDSSYVLQYTCYAALCQGSAVCQGIAVTFYRLCLEAGVSSARVVSCDSMRHSWNIVDPGVGKYYYGDVTWDLGGSTTYFLKGWNYYSKNHSALGVSDPGDLGPVSCVRESDGNIYLHRYKANAVYSIDSKDFNKADLPVEPTVKISLPAPVITLAANYADYIKVAWQPVSGAESYRLSYREGTGPWIKYCDTPSTAIKVTSCKDGGTYTFKVECYSKDGKVRMSEESNRMGQMRLTTPTVKVSRFGTAGESGGFRVDWTATAGGSQYKIYYREKGGSWVLYTMIPKNANTLFCNIKADVTNNTATMTNLVPGHSYEFMVLSCTSVASVTSGFPTSFVSAVF